MTTRKSGYFLAYAGKRLYEGADKIADVLVEKGKDRRRAKGDRIKAQLTSMASDISRGAKERTAGITPRSILEGVSCEIDMMSSTAKTGFNDLLNIFTGGRNG